MRKHAIRRLFGALTAFCMALSCAGPPVAAASGAADMTGRNRTADALEMERGVTADAMERGVTADASETNGGAETASPDADAELFADTSRCGPNALWTLENGVLKITGTGEMYDGGEPWNEVLNEILSVEIQEGIEGIGRNAFADCVNLRTVSIPDGVKRIGESAFSGCASLQSVSIPDSVESIGDYAFSECAALENLSIPSGLTELERHFAWKTSSLSAFLVAADHPLFTSVDGVILNKDRSEILAFPCGKTGPYAIPSTVRRIGSYAFASARIQNMTIPDGVTEIGKSAFYESALEGVIIPQSVTEIGENAFSESALKNLTLPNGVVIGDYAFSFCRSLESVSIPSGARLGRCSFWHCDALRSLDIADGVTEIGGEAFSDCRSLEHIDIPGSVKELDGSAIFSFCESLRTASFAEGVEKINNNIFAHCAMLQSVFIPRSVTVLYENAFQECNCLSDIYYGGSQEEWESIRRYDFLPLTIGDSNPFSAQTHCDSAGLPAGAGSGVIILKSGTCGENLSWSMDSEGVLKITGSGDMDDYKWFSWSNPVPWEEYRNRIWTNLHRIQTIIIEEGVTSVGDYAFDFCDNIREIRLPGTLKRIGAYAFQDVESPNEETLVAFKIPASVSSIGEAALSGNLDVSLEDGNRNFIMSDDVLFSADGTRLLHCNRTKAGECAIPFGVSRIEANAFSFCKNLTGIAMPESLKNIGEEAFVACNITHADFPEGLLEIGKKAFSECVKLKSVRIPESVVSVGEEAFYGCEALETATLANASSEWGKGAFSNCSNLTSIRFPSGLTDVPAFLLSGCHALVSVSLPESVVNIGPSAFASCLNLANAYIPVSVKNIESGAFYKCGALRDAYYGGSEAQWAAVSVEEDNDALFSSDMIMHYNQSPPKDLADIRVSDISGATVTKGMPLDISALTVTAVYADGTSAAVSDYSLFGFNANRLGKQTVGVRYLDQETSFEITVAEAGVTALSVASMPTRRVYHTGDALDLSGLVLSAAYSDYSTKTVTDGYSVSGYDANRVGEQSVTVSYGGQRTSLSVSVIAPETGAEAPSVIVADCPGGKAVSLVSGTADAAIWYTTDGGNPKTSASRRAYDEPFTLTRSATVKAYAALNGADSDVTSVRVTVERVSDVTADRSGNVVTLRTETPGAAIWYGSDAEHMTLKYSGGIAIDRDMTIFATAKKDGWRDSETFEGSYAPEDSGGTENGVEVRLLDAEGTSGGLLSVPVFMYPDGEEDTITSFQIAIRYDSEWFEYDEIAPTGGAENIVVNTKREKGCVFAYYNRIQQEESPSVAPGEIFILYLKAKASAMDGGYDVAVDEERTDICSSASPDSAPLRVVNGKITLSDTVNSLVRRVTLLSSGLSDASGNEVSSLSTPGAARTSFTLEENSAFRADGDLILNVVRAVYAQNGTMLAWDIKTHNFTLNSAFSEVMEIPSGAAGGSVKAMIVDDDLSPRASAIPLLDGRR